MDDRMAGNIRIYQNYYSESHTTYLDPCLTPHDARASLQPDLYEVYWLVSLFENGCYLEQEYTGLVSWKFGQKTGISGRRAIEFITEHPGYDVYLINPFPELAYLFSMFGNAENAGILGSPELRRICSKGQGMISPWIGSVETSPRHFFTATTG